MVRETKSEAVPGFGTLGLDDKLVATLTALGYEEPTPIQREAIPALLEGRDVIGQAATGTGKTAAFALPLIQKLLSRGKAKRGKPAALVLVPTRELAMQVAESMHRYGHPQGIRVLPVYGGQSYEPQVRALHRGVDVVIATPGRALDHIGRGTLDLAAVDEVVLDEADEMLDMGFIEDIESILTATPPERRVVLFSATMPPRIASISKRYMKDPFKIAIAQERVKPGAMPRIRQTAYVVGRAQKRLALGRILDVENPTSAIIFCRTRHEVDELTETLNAHGRSAAPLHGGMSQQQRERVVRKLRDGSSDLVIATDVAARGLDIEQLSHVINYDVPSASEAYVHRIGRVGRAGREGVAITLAEPREHRLLRNIEHATKQKIEIAKVPTLADLRARRLEQTTTAIREAISAGELETCRAVVATLAEEFDLMEIALAAVKLAHQAASTGFDEGKHAQEEIVEQFAPAPRGARRPPRAAGVEMKKLHLNAGRSAGVTPRDLVGAIAGEAGIRGNQIGAIELSDKHSVVEVEAAVAEIVIKALRGSTIKGTKVQARLWQPSSRG